MPSLSDLLLVTGVTGYVGSCLVPHLLEKGYRVRVLVRDPERLHGRAWLPRVEVALGDMLDAGSLKIALEQVTAAIYLVHNMSSGQGYESRELESARNFLAAAEAADIQHIVYLGGLANPQEEIGPHLRSRLQTGEILRSGLIPVTEFRASLVIGSGSISFEMIRYLTEQIPVIVGPRNLKKLTQPIAIQNVLEYLLAALETPACRGRVYEIGGGDVLSYAQTMLTYARLRGLTRRVLLFPWISDTLMAFFTGKLTPVPSLIARPLIGGMRSHSIVRDGSALEMFPQVQPLAYQDSVLQALENLSPPRLDQDWQNGDSFCRMKREGFFIENRQGRIEVQPEVVYQLVSGMGGKGGWIYLNGLWKLRGFIDRLIGGPGLRGRSSKETLSVGDVLDYYCVEAVTPGRLLRLKAELKAPGLGWMEWRTNPDVDSDGTVLSQTVYFAPRGVWGFIYWYFLWPVHALVFAGLIRGIARRAMEFDVSRGDTHED
jgi:uncharacterized protein YbjT (DUF2867 family)